MIKRERRPHGFTQIPNETLRDTRLKDGPYRLLMYMLSMSDNWVFHNSVIAKDLGHNERWVSNQMNILEKYGYMTRQPLRNNKGQIVEWERIVHEKPHVANATPGER